MFFYLSSFRELLNRSSSLLFIYLFKNIQIYGLFGWRGEGRGVEGSRLELAKNKLILC